MAKKSKRQRLLVQLAGGRGEERRQHFAEGNTLSSWRGTSRVEVDRKKRASKRACRKKVKID